MAVKFDPSKLAEPIAKVYQEITDQVLENIARHFNTGKNLAIEEWQLKKLAELGQVQKETLRIIARKTGQNEELVKTALQSAIDAALKDSEPALKEAARKGFLSDAVELTASESVKQVLTSYLEQAMDHTNLVNTVMLDSGLNAFRTVVSDVVQWEQRLTTAAQTKAAQEILNAETGKVLTGVSSRREALKRAIKRMADNGLTGFVDRGGHNWTPEAYINMDIRTTCGNVATQAVFARNEDYGNDLVWVPIKAAARPLCYPWQGKVISTSNRSGTVKDLDDRDIEIIPLSRTSYGEPAGLWGINCGHTPPNPFTPGLSKIRGKVPNEEKNDKDYAESQRQQYIERQIRYAKREAVTLKAAGLDTADADAKVKRYQADMRAFINETGRTRRRDREQIGAEKTTTLTKPKPTTQKSVSRPAAAPRVSTADLNKTKSQFSALPISKQRDIVSRMAAEWYASGKSGISFTSGKSVDEIAKNLANAGSKTSLAKDYMALKKKLESL